MTVDRTLPADAQERAAASRRSPIMRGLAWLLAWPLWQKLLIANATVVLLATVAGAVITADRVRAEPDTSLTELVIPLLVITTAVSVLVNALVVGAALTPLRRIEVVLDRLRGGDRSARVEPGLLADRDLRRIALTFNAMLDENEARRAQAEQASSAALRAQEEERRRIARELHDDTAQSLTSILLYIAALKRRDDLPSEVGAILTDLSEGIRASLEGARALARELRPSALDDLGLVAAIEWYAGEAAKRLDIPVEVRQTCAGVRLPEPVELALYRICQEALTNIGKHAEASHVWIDLTCEPDHVRLRIRDDGRGFEQSRLTAPDVGLGLYGMRERAGLIGGTISIDSRPGAGATITVDVPREP